MPKTLEQLEQENAELLKKLEDLKKETPPGSDMKKLTSQIQALEKENETLKKAQKEKEEKELETQNKYKELYEKEKNAHSETTGAFTKFKQQVKIANYAVAKAGFSPNLVDLLPGLTGSFQFDDKGDILKPDEGFESIKKNYPQLFGDVKPGEKQDFGKKPGAPKNSDFKKATDAELENMTPEQYAEYRQKRISSVTGVV